MAMTLLASGYLVAALLGAAAFLKVSRWADFRAEVHDYAWLPRPVENTAAVALPVTEALAVVAFVIPATRVLGSILISVLLAVFSMALALQIRAGSKATRCACFGRSQRPISWRLVWRNVGLAAPMVVIASAGVPERALPPVSAWVAAALAGVLATVVYEYAGLHHDLREA